MCSTCTANRVTPGPPRTRFARSLQVLNHLQDCRKDLADLDRCYLPDDLMQRFGAGVDDLRKPEQTAGLRRVFAALLDRCDALNRQAAALPAGTGDRRLRLETAVIVGLSRRLAARLRRGDPIAVRVKLTRMDVAASVLAALRFLGAP